MSGYQYIPLVGKDNISRNIVCLLNAIGVFKKGLLEMELPSNWTEREFKWCLDMI
jgi:hypothetical protein